MSAATKGYIIDEQCKYKTATIAQDDEGVVYSCTLNQTELDANKNKFYIMQVLKNGEKYIFYKKFGRIGDPGKTLYDNHTDKDSAIEDFKKQFRSKTGNNRGTKNFDKKDGKYI